MGELRLWRVMVSGLGQMPFFQTVFVVAVSEVEAIQHAVTFVLGRDAESVTVDPGDVELLGVDESRLPPHLPRTTKAAGEEGVAAYTGRVFVSKADEL